MRLRDQAFSRATPESVWRIVADPTRLPEWNPKVVSVARDGPEPPGLGDRFHTVYRMSGRDVPSMAEVTELLPPERLTFRVTGQSMPPGGFVLESYRLVAAEGGTRVRQILDLRKSGIPFLARLVMVLVQRFGRPTGTPYLERLAALAESERG